MAKRRKGRKGKGRKRGRGYKKAVRRVKHHKPGVAESIGLAYTGLKVAPTAWSAAKAVAASPSPSTLESQAVILWNSAKASAEPALLGIIVSNADKLPLVGKLVGPFKHKMDRVMKSYIGMKV